MALILMNVAERGTIIVDVLEGVEHQVHTQIIPDTILDTSQNLVNCGGEYKTMYARFIINMVKTHIDV